MIYGASALAFASSAALFVTVIAIGGGPSGVILDRLANLLILGGGVLLVVAVAVLLASYRPKKSAKTSILEFGSQEAVPRLAWVAGWAFLVFLIPVAILGFFARTSTIGAANAATALVMGGAALSFLVSISTPGLVLSHRPRDKTFWWIAASVAIGVVGIGGQIALTFVPALQASMWIGLGGIPLINWNLPFGAMVGISAVLLALFYLSVARATG